VGGRVKFTRWRTNFRARLIGDIAGAAALEDAAACRKGGGGAGKEVES
jgi:hypothetical protein